VVKYTEYPAWQAAMDRPTASMVLPTPGGPSRHTFARCSTNASVARSFTLRWSSSGWKVKSNSSRDLWWGRGELQSVAEPPALPDPDLLLEHQVQELPAAHLGLLGPLHQLLGSLHQVSEMQTLGVGLDAIGQELAHQEPPWVWKARS